MKSKSFREVVFGFIVFISFVFGICVFAQEQVAPPQAPQAEEAAKSADKIPSKEELIQMLRDGRIREFNRKMDPQISLSGADLHGARLRGADFLGVSLCQANLSGADLRQANLLGTYFINTNLSRADLEGNELTGADLRGADLHQADLTDTDLRGTNLWYAKGLPQEIQEEYIRQLRASWQD